MIELTLAMAEKYLEEHGWDDELLLPIEVRLDPTTQFKNFRAFCKHGEMTGVLVPRKKLGDFNRRMVELLVDLASVEKRTEHEILREMTGCEWLEAILFFKEHGYKS